MKALLRYHDTIFLIFGVFWGGLLTGVPIGFPAAPTKTRNRQTIAISFNTTYLHGPYSLL